MRNKVLLIVICFLFLPSLGFAKELYVLETISKIISGDTFQLESGKKVRLIGVDAPEKKANAKAKEDSKRTGQDVSDIVSRGKEVIEWITPRLKGKKVFLKFDTKREDEDEAEWVYAYLYDVSGFYGGIVEEELIEDLKFDWWEVFQRGKYIFINATIIKAGYATPVRDAPNLKHADLFEEAYWDAKEKGEGLWNNDFFDTPCKKAGERVTHRVGCFIRCCKGLEPIFNEFSDGQCGETPAIGSVGYCSDCGNNKCESKYLEDSCTCPKDCN